MLSFLSYIGVGKCGKNSKLKKAEPSGGQLNNHGRHLGLTDDFLMGRCD
jgi:hypothetical protein